MITSHIVGHKFNFVVGVECSVSGGAEMVSMGTARWLKWS